MGGFFGPTGGAATATATIWAARGTGVTSGGQIAVDISSAGFSGIPVAVVAKAVPTGEALDLKSISATEVVYWLEGSAGDELANVNPGLGREGLTWDGENFWSSENSGDKCYQFTPSGAITTSFVGPDTFPADLAWDGSNLWLAGRTNDDIFELTISGTVLSSFDTPGANPRALTWDGSNLWASDQSVAPAKVYEVTTVGAIVSSFSGPDNAPGGLTWDGTYIWVNGNANDKCYQCTTTGTIQASFAVSGEFLYGGASWDGQHLWVASNSAYFMKLRTQDNSDYELYLIEQN